MHFLVFRYALSNIFSDKCIVFQATSISEAINIVSGNNIDYICSDYNLPDGTGIDFLIQLHNNGKHIPFVIISANVNFSIELEAKVYGALKVIEKTSWNFVESLKNCFHIW
ncbi:TPA: response regulator [Clostridioides difficile]|uniref:response regulator n=1 Tax=Clostridioides difficile TaxID=1496 RepID=UPI000BB18551|nr:hypothetical protein BGV10_01490 [Clostridioides difficile]HEK8913962.1 response regulator [Clostridioides difficile]